ncbi:uncharacterized protein si:dkey-9i23.16 isoform X2 [Oreochromis aureus]|uniref:uncharacterized protein si:dkey-9i23.16 isoform X2 n=1 Tax=Oreochromis aureus TaxID=47969 RepID=UPI0003941269|nr:uncharacterized protein si:dkey-9i23.16 isoform X2 [Oreochromis aureus]CAI5681611.1 unnamed protein product [Mustela putorius furo]
MASEGARLRRLFAWFDPESVAVLTILLGLFQVLFSAPFAYIDQSFPKLFILPLVLGIVVMAGGSFTMANEKNPSRLLDYSWSVTLLLLLFDTGAVVMHCLLSISAFKTLKTN